MIASGGGGDASSFVSLPFFYLAAVVLEVRVISGQVPVVVDADHKGISLIVLKPVKVFLTPDLVHGNIRTVSVLKFHKQRGLLRIPGASAKPRTIGRCRSTLCPSWTS